MRARVRVGAVLATGLAAGFVAWVLLERVEDDPPATTVTTASAAPAPRAAAARPTLASVADLQRAAASSRVPIYWVGPRPRTRIELTQTPDGGPVIVRYLPPGTDVGAPGEFLTIATYPRQNGFREVLAAATAPAASTIRLAGGGVAVYNPEKPANLHLAYPGQQYQIEVFAPQRGVARTLVAAGAVRPAG